jgi:hypothetical protein
MCLRSDRHRTFHREDDESDARLSNGLVEAEMQRYLRMPFHDTVADNIVAARSALQSRNVAMLPLSRAFTL